MNASTPEGWEEKRHQFAELIERFGKGWERGEPEEITGVFSDGATFLPSPFDPPIVGKETIADYWKDTPAEQADVSFRYGEIFMVGPWFATEYKCTFRRRRTGHKVDIRGALFCETENNAITEMRMYWHRTVD